jgi:hypothetical protein
MKIRSNFTHTLSLALISMILLSFLMELNAQIVDVWAVGDGEKIFRNNTEHPAKSGNSIWDGEHIHLRGLYNEVLGFQVIVEVDSTGAEGLELSMDPPLHQPSRMETRELLNFSASITCM